MSNLETIVFEIESDYNDRNRVVFDNSDWLFKQLLQLDKDEHFKDCLKKFKYISGTHAKNKTNNTIALYPLKHHNRNKIRRNKKIFD